MNTEEESLEAIRMDFRARKAAQRRTLGDKIAEAGMAMAIVGAAVVAFWALLKVIP